MSNLNNMEKTEEDFIVDTINIFQTYYRKLFNNNNNNNNTESIFEGIDNSNPLSTNRSMEFLYEHIYKNKNIDPDINKLYAETDDIDLEKFDELFALLIDGDIKKLSPSLYMLINYFAHTYENWYEINWNIINLKNN